MFDWDDQELANIIWDENTGADDHIVPYSEDIEKKYVPDYGDNDTKKLNEEDTNSKAAEQNRTKSLSIGGKPENNDGVSSSGALVDPQLDLPSFTTRAEDNAIAKKNQLDTGLGISQNQHEDKELGELVGNSWTNIGSFDDLDRIFSNDDLDGHNSLGSADDLWPSSKGLISGAKSSSQALGSTSWEFGALGNTSAHFEVNSEYLHDENDCLTSGSQNKDAISSCSRQNFGKGVEQKQYAVGTTSSDKEKTAMGMTVKAASNPHLPSENVAAPNKSAYKANWPKHQSKIAHRSEKISDSRLLQHTYDTWQPPAANIPQFDGQCAPVTVQNYPASVSSQKRFPQDSSSMAGRHFSSPYVTSYGYGNFAHQNPAIRMLKPIDDEHQSMLFKSEACPVDVRSLNKPVETSAAPVIMTPQEKIEKLRRRQQMRAMLAIQKQQQQLGHQASSVDYTLSQKSCAEDQALHTENIEADESLSTLPCYDPGSPNKRDDSSTISNIDDCSAEDAVLHDLQDVIAKLDLKIRLGVRDSLYRLAHSATHRSYRSDTSSTNRNCNYEADIAKEEISSNDRFDGKANVETETNQLDRVVAHLLFHRPLKLSMKHVETPESSTSTKMSIEQETASPSSLSVGILGKSSKTEYNLSPHGSKTAHPFVDSRDEDILNDNPRNEMRIKAHMKQKMAEDAE